MREPLGPKSPLLTLAISSLQPEARAQSSDRPSSEREKPKTRFRHRWPLRIPRVGTRYGIGNDGRIGAAGFDRRAGTLNDDIRKYRWRLAIVGRDHRQRDSIVFDAQRRGLERRFAPDGERLQLRIAGS